VDKLKVHISTSGVVDLLTKVFCPKFEVDRSPSYSMLTAYALRDLEF